MNRKDVKIDKELFDEVMFADYLEWATSLDSSIYNFWLENEDFRNNLVQVKVPKQLDKWYKEFVEIYRSGKLNDDVEVAMYEFIALTPKKYVEKEITLGYKKHVQEQAKKVNEVLNELRKKGVIYLEYLGYSTKKEDIEQTEKYQKEYDFIIDIVEDKIEKDTNRYLEYVEDWLTIEYFGIDDNGKDWFIKLRTDNNDYYFKLNDILLGTDYVEKLKD